MSGSSLSVKAIALLTTLTLASACGSSDTHKQAQQLHSGLTGAATDGRSTNPLCSIFTATEVAAFENASLKDATDAAAGTGCQWMHRQGEGSAMLQVVRSDDQPDRPPSGRDLPDIGSQAFIEPYLGGWHAAAIAKDKSINVMTSASSSQDKTIAFLREAVSRYATR
jgi:hypothetical protein